MCMKLFEKFLIWFYTFFFFFSATFPAEIIAAILNLHTEDLKRVVSDLFYSKITKNV